MAHTYPVDIAREIDRRWERRALVAASAQNDNHIGDGLCPICHGYASIGPLGAEYYGKGVLHRHWLCRACGHEWVTVLHVLA